MALDISKLNSAIGHAKDRIAALETELAAAKAVPAPAPVEVPFPVTDPADQAAVDAAAASLEAAVNPVAAS